MCGIAGIVSFESPVGPDGRSELSAMCLHMAKRGPDGHGEWVSPDGRVALGHRRLAIIDLSPLGAQPMADVGRDVVLVFNGEIYNFRELRRELETKGHRFRSQSDTEVLLALYLEYGESCANRLRGMFAYAIWDGRLGTLILGRDPFGIKPLYYSVNRGAVRFASQVKALEAGGRISRELDAAGVAGFLMLGAVPDPFTIFRSISAVPAGTTMRFAGAQSMSTTRYAWLGEGWRAPAENRRAGTEERVEQAGAALRRTVARHLISDVPVGAFLSAGIDSSTLVAHMADLGHRDLRTVTLAFDEFQGTADDEAPLAVSVAGRFGTAHTTRVIGAGEFRDDLPRIYSAMDQPSVDGINTWFVCKAAREAGLKVAISGLGGDELLGGYPSFRTVPLWNKAFSVAGRVPGADSAWRALLAILRMAGVSLPAKAEGMARFCRSVEGSWFLQRAVFLPGDLAQLMGPELAAAGLERLGLQAWLEDLVKGEFQNPPIEGPQGLAPFGRVSLLETTGYMKNQLLRDTDWASMAHSIEVRVPLVDEDLARAIAPLVQGLEPGQGKRLLALTAPHGLPPGMSTRPKTGFSTPVARWRAEALRSSSEEGEAGTPRGLQTRRWALEVIRQWTDLPERGTGLEQ